MYSSSDLAFIIPTKNRPEEVKRHLQSLAKQDCKIGRIIIIASGEDIQKIVLEFSEMLPVEYYRSKPGQIKQRNLGISFLDESTKLVATMDDDITYEKDAINKMISFWNSVDKQTAGVGFNVMNLKKHKHSWIKGFLGLSVQGPGMVLKSGVNTSITNISQNMRSDWLNGGATVWRKDILTNFKHNQIKSKWAVYEDIIFSYPIGKIYPLFVCSEAKVNVEIIPHSKSDFRNYIFRGKSEVLWMLLFVLNNSELSITKCYFVIFIKTIFNFLYGLISFQRKRLFIAIGYSFGILMTLFIKRRKQIDIISLIQQ